MRIHYTMAGSTGLDTTPIHTHTHTDKERERERRPTRKQDKHKRTVGMKHSRHKFHHWGFIRIFFREFHRQSKHPSIPHRPFRTKNNCLPLHNIISLGRCIHTFWRILLQSYSILHSISTHTHVYMPHHDNACYVDPSTSTHRTTWVGMWSRTFEIAHQALPCWRRHRFTIPGPSIIILFVTVSYYTLRRPEYLLWCGVVWYAILRLGGGGSSLNTDDAWLDTSVEGALKSSIIH